MCKSMDKCVVKLWSRICSVFNKIGRCCIRGFLRLPECTLGCVRKHDRAPTTATIDDVDCTRQANVITRCCWNNEFQGLTIHDLRLHRGKIVVYTMPNGNEYIIDLVQEKCNNDTILFSEVQLHVDNA